MSTWRVVPDVPATTSTAMAQLLSAMVVLVAGAEAGGLAAVVGALVLVGATVVVDVVSDVVVVAMVVGVSASVLPPGGVVADVVDVVVEVRTTVVVLAGIVVAGGVIVVAGGVAVVASDVASPSPPHAAITRVPVMRSSAGVFIWRGLAEWCVGEQRTWCHCRRGLLQSLSRVPCGFMGNTYKM